MISRQDKPLAPPNTEQMSGPIQGQKGLGRVCYQGLGPRLPEVWPSASGAWWGLTEDDRRCVVTELSLGRGVRGKEHIEEPEGGGRGEQQPQQQPPLPWGGWPTHFSPSAIAQ